jgi:hypothetical protein
MVRSGFLYFRINDIKHYKDVDILFLGSSLSYRGFDVRIFKKYGYAAFNLGSSAQTPIQTKVLVERYLKTLNPKRIVYAVDPAMFGRDGVESALDIISNDANDKESFEMVFNINNLKVWNTFFYALERNLLQMDRTKNKEIPAISNKDIYITGGYVETTASKFESQEKYYERSIKILPQQYKVFQKVISIFKEHKIKYILVFPPFSHNYYETKIKAGFGDFERLMGENGDYFNFNDIINLDNSFFTDEHHLNQKGVEQFNEKLMEELLR